MIKQLLRQLRKKPKPTRDAIAFSVALSFTGAVTLMWLYHTPKSIGDLNQNLEVASSPFADFFDTAKKQISETRQIIQGENMSSSTPENAVAPENDMTEGGSATTEFDNSDIYLYGSSSTSNMEMKTTQISINQAETAENNSNTSSTMQTSGNRQVPISLPELSATGTATSVPAN